MKVRIGDIQVLKKESKNLCKKKMFWKDLLFPPRCAICDEVADDKVSGVCKECVAKINYVKPPFCMKCGKHITEEEGEYCADCKKTKHFFVQGIALYEYGSMADSLFRFKYACRAEYAVFYGRELWEKCGRWLLSLDADALIPVPAHSSRVRKCGYNQAALLAEELSKHSGIPVNEKLIIKTKHTKEQKKLSLRQRQNNLKKAFKILQNDVKLNTVVIIDDIYTTGSTMDAVSELLLGFGVSKIYFMVMAIGQS